MNQKLKPVINLFIIFLGDSNDVFLKKRGRGIGRPKKLNKKKIENYSNHSESDTKKKHKDSDLIDERGSEDHSNIQIISYEIPKRIISAKINEKGKIFFFIEWNERSDGTKPEDSYINNQSMRTYFPNMLLDFYQSKVVSLK